MLDTVKVDLLLNPYVMTVKFKSLITSKFMSISEFKITYLAVDNSFLNSTLLLIFASIIMVSNFIFFTFKIFLSVINIIFSWYDKVKMERLHISILSELMQKTINLDLSFFDNTTSYDKYNRAYANCCNVVNSVNSIISTFILSLTNTLLISSLLVWMDLYMYLLMFATIFLNLILTNLIKKRDYVYNFKVSEKNKQLNYIYRLFYIPQLT